MTRRSLIVLSVLLIIVGSIVFLLQRDTTIPTEAVPDPVPEVVSTPALPPRATSSVTNIGTSVEGRPIMSYEFGTGSTTLLFVGGMHGGYEWNSSALAYEFIAALSTEEIKVPETLTVIIIPTLNPDGLFAATNLEGHFTTSMVPENDAHTTGEGRFNANDVDLNRNFDCKWKSESSWRNKKVSAGTAPFSEPEAVALKEIVLAKSPRAVVFWHSQANAVYGSECMEGILPGTTVLLEEYATAAQYTAVPRFDAYPVTGDAEGWLASIGIPAVTVELATRTTTEWEQNRRGVEALLSVYGK